MKHISLLVVAVTFAAAFTARAATLNDGTTTARLVQVTNLVNDAGGETRLTALPEGILQAEQIGDAFPALSTAWYSSVASATSKVYTVSADFRPAGPYRENRGGVIGWLNTGASNGIVLQVVPGGTQAGFLLSCLDFALSTDNADQLYNLDGSAAAVSAGSAWSALGTNYVVGEFATFELEFTNASAADLSALPDATARLIARVWQGTGTNRVQVSETIELLTDLPLPASGEHRIGYFGVWSSVLYTGETIGYYDNLNATGGIEIVNLPPTVQMTRPLDGASFVGPASVALAADVSDADGQVTRVEFYSGTNLLATVAQAPFTATWSNVPIGSYTLHAVATDDDGASQASAPVSITVIEGSGTGPTMNVAIVGSNLIVSWSSPGYELQYKTNLDAPTWTAVPGSTSMTQYSMPFAGGPMHYFRLVGSGPAVGPALSVGLEGTQIVVSWPVPSTGYRLQSKASLSDANWQEVTGATNPYRAPATGLQQFYRLIQ